jgi:hypothetical protein
MVITDIRKTGDGVNRKQDNTDQCQYAASKKLQGANIDLFQIAGEN